MPEKPKEFISNLINTGLYRFDQELFQLLETIPKSPRGEYEINDAIMVLAKEKKVKVMEVKGFWKDFGKPEDIVEFEKFIRGEKWK